MVLIQQYFPMKVGHIMKVYVRHSLTDVCVNQSVGVTMSHLQDFVN